MVPGGALRSATHTAAALTSCLASGSAPRSSSSSTVRLWPFEAASISAVAPSCNVSGPHVTAPHRTIVPPPTCHPHQRRLPRRTATQEHASLTWHCHRRGPVPARDARRGPSRSKHTATALTWSLGSRSAPRSSSSSTMASRPAEAIQTSAVAPSCNVTGPHVTAPHRTIAPLPTSPPASAAFLASPRRPHDVTTRHHHCRTPVAVSGALRGPSRTNTRPPHSRSRETPGRRPCPAAAPPWPCGHDVLLHEASAHHTATLQARMSPYLVAPSLPC